MEDVFTPWEFDGYRVVSPLGGGGMGRVFLGHDTLLDRPVAIKFIATQEPDAEARRRFLVEARAIARLQHPRVVAIYRVGEFQGVPYLVSEYVPGRSLDRVEVPLPWRQVLGIGLDLARALAAAHRRGVVHRDVKPANAILGDDGTVKLLDFGIARLLQESCRSPTVDSPGAMPTTVRSVAAHADAPTAQVAVPPGGDPASTDAGIVLGTPAYMAPEAWLGLPVGFPSDVYSLGALLHTLAAGHPPHTGDTIEALRHAVLFQDVRPLVESVPGIDPGFAFVVDRCLRRAPGDRFPSADEVRSELSRLAGPGEPVGTPEGNPYRGLRAFEAEHRGVFFGRDSEIRDILDRLGSEPMVLVAGDSGVGKSSLCRAGVLPRIREAMESNRTWIVAEMVPGRRPLATLTALLSSRIGISEEVLAQALAEGANPFGREVRRSLGSDRGLVLFIDQMEEMALQSAPDEADALAQILASLSVSVPGIRILGTARGDFLGRLAAFPALADVLPRTLYFLRPLSPDRVREAIVGPARTRGVRFQPETLVEELVDSTVRAEGGLPLLQFALEKLWEVRDEAQGVIHANALEALGGVAGALSVHADEVLARLRPAQREEARRMMLRLVTAEGTRARRTMEELAGDGPEAEVTLDALVRGRLLVAREIDGQPGYEIAHEALLQGWDTLARWLSVDVDARIIHERLARACADWKRLGRPRDGLLSRSRLDEASLVPPGSLGTDERTFLAASRQRLRGQQWVRRGVAIGVLLAIGLAWGGFRVKAAMDLDSRVRKHLQTAQGHLDAAHGHGVRLGEVEAEAFRRFDLGESQEAEAAFSEANASHRRSQEALRRGIQELETAFSLDPDQAMVRNLLADVLMERALQAEARHDKDQMEEAFFRMALFDDGRRVRLFNAPGVVRLESNPRDVETTLARYVRDPGGLLELQEMDTPHPWPIEGLSLAPGSYLLRARTADRPETRLPFTVQRGQEVQLDLNLPSASDIPPGFIHVPAGRFMYGSADEDSIRRGYYQTVPMHARSTGSFLVARHETTYAQWIEYLEALAPDERQGRLPEVHAGGFEGALTFRQEPDGAWRLTFKPTDSVHTARQGEMLEYPQREQRATQDWMRFPVAGVTAADAATYAAWLGETGRVPGARLCTELEWERAARGADDRPYPHGFALDPADANFDATHGKKPPAMGPDEVGSFPQSESPFGLMDVSGNVWEWTVSSLGSGGHVARGGSFYFDVNSARVYKRETPEPSFRDVSVGFRVCADLPAPR